MYKDALAELNKEKDLRKKKCHKSEAMIAATNTLMGERKEALQLLNDLLERSKHVHVRRPHGFESSRGRTHFIISHFERFLTKNLAKYIMRKDFHPICRLSKKYKFQIRFRRRRIHCQLSRPISPEGPFQAFLFPRCFRHRRWV